MIFPSASKSFELCHFASDGLSLGDECLAGRTGLRAAAQECQCQGGVPDRQSSLDFQRTCW